MWQFAEAIEGIAAACRALDVPITGGNVSLYNETDGQAIYPTPTIGVVGVMEMPIPGRRPCVPGSGDAIILLGERFAASSAAASSEDRAQIWSAGIPPTWISMPSARSQTCSWRAATPRLMRSAHDVRWRPGRHPGRVRFDTGGIGV